MSVILDIFMNCLNFAIHFTSFEQGKQQYNMSETFGNTTDKDHAITN